MKELRHILMAVATILAMAALSSCASDKWQSDVIDPESGEDVYLSITLSTIGEGDLSDLPLEQISNYVVVVVNSKGEIDAMVKGTAQSDGNYAGNVDDKIRINLPVTHFLMNNVKDQKTIYAIANYDMVKENLGIDSWEVGTQVKNDIENCQFTLDTTKGNIPLFGSCELDLTNAEKGSTILFDLYMVRVATKFEFTVHNQRNEALTVTDLTLHNLASSQYLKPHFKPGYGIISLTGHHGFYFNKDLSDPFFDINPSSKPDKPLSWDEWLAEAVRESHGGYGSDRDYTNEDVADTRGWIMEYGTPPTATHEEKSFSELQDKTYTVKSKDKLDLDTHYYPESRGDVLNMSVSPVVNDDKFDMRGKDYSNSNGETKNAKTLICDAAAGLQQYYYFSITFKDSKDVERTFYLDFYNLRALFRNTDVRVDITVTGNTEVEEVEWTVYTRNWHLRIQPEIVLSPESPQPPKGGIRVSNAI